MGNRTKRTAKSKRSYYRSPYGVWLSDRDIRYYTPPDERKGYKLMSVGMGAMALGFGILAIAGVSELIAGTWIVLALLCLTLLFVFAPMGWSRNLAARQPDVDLHTQLNPARVDNFWYERGVSDNPHFPDNQPHPGEQAPIETSPERHDEPASRRE